MSQAENVYKELNRLRKVNALVAYFDRFMAHAGFHPQRDAAALVDTLTAMKGEIWNVHAHAAGCKHPPSSETIDAVIAVYQGRAEGLVGEAEPARVAS